MKNLVAPLEGQAVAGVTRVGVDTAEYRGVLDYQFVFSNSSGTDLRSRSATKELFRTVRPTRVLHLAAHIAPTGVMREAHGTYYIDNRYKRNDRSWLLTLQVDIEKSHWPH